MEKASLEKEFRDRNYTLSIYLLIYTKSKKIRNQNAKTPKLLLGISILKKYSLIFY